MHLNLYVRGCAENYVKFHLWAVVVDQEEEVNELMAPITSLEMCSVIWRGYSAHWAFKLMD